MSLVEKALKKLQDSRNGAGSDRSSPMANAVVATVVEAPPAVRSVSTVARRSDKIVEISWNALRAVGLVPPEHQERQIANEYRQIKRPLVANAIGRDGQRLANGRVLMVASALPGEGKTFTTFNLALSLAQEKDISVLLVDADIPKPHVSRLLGVDKEPGLMDALVNPALDPESLVLTTNINGLSLLPAGHASDSATELLASARMQEIVAQLSANDPRRVVLFDSPPLLMTTESRALAGVVGQVVLVVRAGITPQQAVSDAISFVGEGRSIGLILNQSVNSGHGGYYGYGNYGKTDP